MLDGNRCKVLWEDRGVRHKGADYILSWSRQVATILSLFSSSDHKLYCLFPNMENLWRISDKFQKYTMAAISNSYAIYGANDDQNIFSVTKTWAFLIWDQLISEIFFFNLSPPYRQSYFLAQAIINGCWTELNLGITSTFTELYNPLRGKPVIMKMRLELS